MKDRFYQVFIYLWVGTIFWMMATHQLPSRDWVWATLVLSFSLAEVKLGSKKRRKRG